MPSQDERILTLLENVVELVKVYKPTPPTPAEEPPPNEIVDLVGPEPEIPSPILPVELVQIMTDKNGLPLSEATKKAYTCRIKAMVSWFPEEDFISLLKTDIYRILFEVKCRYNNLSTQRSCFSALSQIIKELEIPDTANMSNIIRTNRDDDDFQSSQNKKKQLKTTNIETSHERSSQLKEKNAYFREKMTVGDYTHTISKEVVKKSKTGATIYKKVDYAQMAAVTQLFLDTGVLRSHELRECRIVDNDFVEQETPTCNYINVDTKQLIVTKHKNQKFVATKQINLSDEFIAIVKPGVGQFLVISPKNKGKADELYADTTGYNKMLKRDIGISYSTMRQDKDTIAISLGKEETEKVSKAHGHTKATMEKYYQTAVEVEAPAS